MKPERLSEIRKVAERGDLTAPEHIRDGLRDLLALVDEMAGEYTADPPAPKPTPQQASRIAEYDGLQAGDVVASRGVEYTVGARPMTTDAIEIRRSGGLETALEATIIRPEDWLSGAWSIVHRKGEPRPTVESVGKRVLDMARRLGEPKDREIPPDPAAVAEKIDEISAHSAEHEHPSRKTRPTIEEYDSLRPGDVIAKHGTEYEVAGFIMGTNKTRIRTVRGDIGWSSSSSSVIRPPDWLSGAWTIVRRAGEDATV